MSMDVSESIYQSAGRTISSLHHSFVFSSYVHPGPIKDGQSKLDFASIAGSGQPPNMLAQLLGGTGSPFFPVPPFLQKYQSLFGLSLLFLDSKNHGCCRTVNDRTAFI